MEYPVKSWKYVSKGDVLTVTIVYRYTKTEFEAIKKRSADALYKARHIVSGFIKPEMADFDKELYIHDYVVNNTKYDYSNYLNDNIPDTSFNAYGSLILGKAVCEGYSKAFKLLCDLSGLECMLVEGKSRVSGSSWINHAWNIVKIDGSFYHVDSTFDDPVMPNGKDVLSYDYFNLTDKSLTTSHTWSKVQYPECSTNWTMAFK